MVKKVRLLLITALVSVLSLGGLFVFVEPATSSALSGSKFRAGQIIDDNVFFRKQTMSASQIQAFLNSKVPVCDTNHPKTSSSKDSGPPYTCLKSYRDDIKSKPAESGLCDALSAQSNQLASVIIYKVGKACGVSQKALLVLLQKEQSLVTDTWPWDIQYRSATGYGCPDSAPCDSEYYGFFNQVYKAAWQFKRYAKFPNSYNHKKGFTSFVQYHPNAGCGGKNVNMKTKATAGLYNYTPYTPNQAALNNLYGTGNSCSAYGNRNFWRMYNDWFGSPYKKLNYRLIECEGEKYMVERWKPRKRPLTDNAVREFGFEEYEFNTDDRGCDYPAYSNALDTIVRSRDSIKSYMLNSGSYHYLQSRSVAHAWGYVDIYDNRDLKPRLDGDTIDDFELPGKTPRLAESANTGKVYLLSEGKIYHISGTPSSVATLRLVRGNGNIPMKTFSGEHLSYLKTNNGEGVSIVSGFRVNESAWYLFDYGKVRRVSTMHYPNRWNVSGVFEGPDLASDTAKYFNPREGLGKGFRKGDSYYIVASGGDVLSTTNFPTAYRWGVTKEVEVTNLFKNNVQTLNSP
ncbi:MAG TPA: hypothetical protein VFX79_02440 [Candidatus Saccharimonadales bacterium]|nr:hypothetical protein [Candidatus Saccharimonadales bacterium]